METLKNMLDIMIDYIFCNQLTIDKATFFTIVIGQMAIYGIVLTFYQFVASYQGNDKTSTRYLGINITEYFVKKNTRAFSKVVSRKIFGVAFILEILYKPFTTVYGNRLLLKMISAMNFMWFLFVIFYFVIFVILFLQCTKSILTIKHCSDVKTNGYLIRGINNIFIKKTVKERMSQNAIELLKQDFVYLCKAIQNDNNPELQEGYNQLIYIIFKEYTERKQYEIFIIESKGKILKNQVPWRYNADEEVYLLKEIIEGKYFQLDEENIRLILNFHIN